MSAGKLERSAPDTAAFRKSADTINLAANAITFRKNGIEFTTSRPVNPWSEIAVGIECPVEQTRVSCRGVVVDCRGSRHAGYRVSLMFLGLTPQVQQRLDSLALAYVG
ncbi:MAG TPA: hypothetical protein PKE47_15445 [Verrucomicrobiota bacterium]|nr:hypothetical protein [Verrucomicrobiota bacterium]